MERPTPYDDFRDLSDAGLDAAAAERLRARIAGDPALSAAFETWQLVHAATAWAPEVPACTLTFERVDAARRADRVRRLRPWLAAAAALLLAAAGIAAFHLRESQVAVHADLLVADVGPSAEPPSPPALLAGYRPVADGRVRWIDSLETGREVARVVRRPIFVWVYHPTCPLCVGWDRGAFRDPQLEAKVAEFVPVRLNVMDAMSRYPWVAELVQDMDKNWPYLGVMTADGDTRIDFAGQQTKEEILEHLTAALAAQATADAPLAWDAVDAAATATAKAKEALAAGRVGDAWTQFSAVLAIDAKGAFGALARWHLERLTGEARVAMSEAKALSATDAAAGARRLSVAAERFRGTPYGTDLAEVEQELRATGRFPVLTAEAAPTQK
jgi:hypothetical protein